MIYTEYQQVLLTQLQNNDKIIEEIKKEQEEIQGKAPAQEEQERQAHWPSAQAQE